MTPEQENEVPQLPANQEALEALIRQIYKEESAAEKAGKVTMTEDKMRAALNALPDSEILREYETTVAKKYADKWADDSIHTILPALINVKKEGEKVAFGAFAVAVNYERLNKNYSAEQKLLNTHREAFSKHPFFDHLDLLYRMDVANGLYVPEDFDTDKDSNVISRVLSGLRVEKNEAQKKADFLKDTLYLAKKNAKTLAGNSVVEGNYGGYHAFAELTALLFETAPDELRPFLTDPKNRWLELARDAATKAIAADSSYAKYYCTYGRVLALLGQWDEAIHNVNIAIDLEDNTRSNYAIRISDYTNYRQQFRAQQSIEEQKTAIDEKMRDVTQQMESREKETLTKNMEFLGLFSGIVSFTIGSLTLASNVDTIAPLQLAGLIVVLLGALVCVFAAFGVILHGFIGTFKSKKGGKTKYYPIIRHILIFILGMLIIVGGIERCIK